MTLTWRQMQDLNNSRIKTPCRQWRNNKVYQWTGDQREIVEVILLLGSINNGNATKSEFFKFIVKF